MSPVQNRPSTPPPSPLKGLPPAHPAIAPTRRSEVSNVAPPPQPNLGLAIVAGLIAAFISAGLWAAATVAVGYQIGFMAMGVGLVVGLTVRVVGRGQAPIYSLAGSLLALVGCLMGNLLAFTALDAEFNGSSFVSSLLNTDLATASERMLLYFNPIDLLFYGIALYEAFRLSRYEPVHPESLLNQDPTVPSPPKAASHL